MSSLIAVVDYGMGNLRSVSKALEHVAQTKQKVIVTSDASVIAEADRIVFPGQGAAGDCMTELERLKLIEPILKAASEKPFLGICMGMQVLMTHSEENAGIDCIGLYPGDVRFFGAVLNQDKAAEKLKIPHMGWNNVRHKRLILYGMVSVTIIVFISCIVFMSTLKMKLLLPVKLTMA